MIEATELTKTYGRTSVVDRLSFTARSGEVTGFLGPNGAGKSTTMRMILGLTRPTSGTATIDGHPFVEDPHPARRVGALLGPEALPPYLTGRQLLRWYATAGRLDPDLVEPTLDRVGLRRAQGKRIEAYSFGMRQRLAMGCVLLGRPQNLILDEPVNGLDPAGVRWVRELLTELADQGSTILLSSHLLSEIEQVADHVVLISAGRVRVDARLTDLVAERSLEDMYIDATREDL